MGRFVLLVCILARVTAICPAQTITETFGTGPNALTIDFVSIGNPGNTADNSSSVKPIGSVPYAYNLGKYEISFDQFRKGNNLGNLGLSIFNFTPVFGRDQTYAPNHGNSWGEVAVFVNWLNTSNGYLPAYKFDGYSFQLWSQSDAGYNPNNQYRNSLAKYFLPSRDEWYKGSYGSPDGTWYNYPTGSDNVPVSVANGTDQNTAVYGRNIWTGPADVNNAGGLSGWGTMGQGGNAWEWTESAYDGINDFPDELRAIFGGNYRDDGLNSKNLEASYGGGSTWTSGESIGFRIAMIPEPSSLSLLALGSFVMALEIRRRL
jgi:formylglycine-generating enzyme required for sulfatase activity